MNQLYSKFRFFYFSFILLVTCCSECAVGQSTRLNLLGDTCLPISKVLSNLPHANDANDTSINWSGSEQKILITGTLFKPDRITPANNVIIYYRQSIDATLKNQFNVEWASGYVMTDEKGEYSIYTTRPMDDLKLKRAKPIQMMLIEPSTNYAYCVDDLFFDDDVFFTTEQRTKQKKIGGSGILKVLIPGPVQILTHDIVLGLNVPNYPVKVEHAKPSGLPIGEFNPSFNPFHAWGPDAGNRTCMACMYGRYHGIMYFVSTHSNWNEIKQWLSYFEKESKERGKYLKVFFVYANDINYNSTERQTELELVGQALGLEKIALTYVPSLSDHESEVDQNKINPEIENQIILSLDGVILDKFIDMKPTQDNFKLLTKTLNQSKRDEFDLIEPSH